MNIAKILASLLHVYGIAWVQPLAAHEFWLEPSDYRPAIGQEITVGLSLGDTFYQGIRAKRVNEDIVKFVANGEGGQAPVGGEPGDSPIGKIAFASRGAYIVEFSNHNRFTELDAEVFERYLVHKGLDNAIAARKERGESDKPGREAFRHCLKTIVVAGDPNAEIHDHALGLELEVISESRLDAGRSGDQLSFKVLYQGAPLKDLLVTATRRDAPTDRVSVRTDANGHVEFDLKDPDVWMIDTVYIMPTPNDEKVEWQSVWASLTFQLFPRR